MTIILKTTAPSGWKPARGVLERGRTMCCPRCGAICDESAVGEHESWHADLEHKSLPLLADYVTDWADNPGSEPVEQIESVKVHVALPKLAAAVAEA